MSCVFLGEPRRNRTYSQMIHSEGPGDTDGDLRLVGKLAGLDLRSAVEDMLVVVVDCPESLADSLGAPVGDRHAKAIADHHAQEGTEKPLLIRSFTC
jgi:hypothetical protein